MTSATLRTLTLMAALAASWIYFGLHWRVDHSAPDGNTPEDAAATSRPIPLTSLTAIGELPEEAVFTETPDFATALTIPERGGERFEAEGGVRYWHYQVEHDGTGADARQYVRMVSEPVSTAGIDQAANITIVFNPAYERLEFHTLQVERDGLIEDRSDTTTIEFARRETRLERRMFDGRGTAIVRFSDIRLGDRVEYSYTITGQNPALPDNESREFRLGFGTPVEQVLVRSRWSAEDEPRYQLIGPEPTEALDTGADGQAYVVTFGPVATPPFEGERGAPAWVRQAPVLQISNFENWEAVSRWSAPFYAPEPSDEVVEIADAIRADHDTPEAQLVAALRFVQDEIRYLAISFGAGGYVPASPSETLDRRYGDCKAKTVLLMAVLQALGIEAEAALVHTTQGYALMDTLPRSSAFNHVIVRAELAGTTYWLDGTRSEQGGQLATLAQPDFGWALPISRVGHAPVLMPTRDTTVPSMETHETLTVLDSSGAAQADIEIRARGAGADQMRAGIARAGRADMETRVLNGYQARFGVVATRSDLTVEDDRETNEIRLHMEIDIERAISEHEDGERQQLVGQVPLRSPGRGNVERDRVFPLSLGEPGRQIARVTLNLPDAYSEWAISPASRQLNVDGIEFSLTQARTGNQVTLGYDLHVDRRAVPTEQADAAKEASDQIGQLTRWSLVSP